ncbi:hypothetical protein F4825DRAFT_431091 [Nemania diffusa]|nr:hypothetical protein F4825DRAFT_431091 [Nemania diffusa]
MSSIHETGMPFVVSTGVGKPDPNLRKFIRRHVMIGKNKGKVRPVRSKNGPDSSKSSPESQANSTDSLSTASAPESIPSKVGSDLSTVQFADSVDPSTVEIVLRFSSIAKQALYPLESCISFDKRDSKMWLDPLSYDSAYLHAMIFTTHDYFDLLLNRVASRKSLLHLGRALELLRERLLREDTGQAKISTLTASVVLALTGHALMKSEYAVAKHHMEGLHHIINLKGGITLFRDSTKLLIEILRCDLWMTFQCGSSPLFSDSIQCYPLARMSSPDQISFQALPNRLVHGSNEDLVMSWMALDNFCHLVNSACSSGTRIPKEVFADTMISVMYSLLDQRFEPGSMDELIRLGLLAFSSSVFIQWKFVKVRYAHFSHMYRDCLMAAQGVELAPQLSLWLLVVGSISVFDTEDDGWLKPALRTTMQQCQIESWIDLRDVLQAFLWIGLCHDDLGSSLFGLLGLCIDGY